MGSRISSGVIATNISTKRKFSHFSEKDLKKWEAEFNEMFPYGHMTEKDLISLLSKLFPFGKTKFSSLLFRTINISNTGEIDFSELMIAFSILRKGSVHEKLRWIFRMYDTDGDGVISKDEMQTVVQSFIDMVKPSLNLSGDISSDSIELQNQKSFKASKFVNEIFKECENESGFLSYDDFKCLAQRRNDILEMFELFE